MLRRIRMCACVVVPDFPHPDDAILTGGEHPGPILLKTEGHDVLVEPVELHHPAPGCRHPARAHRTPHRPRSLEVVQLHVLVACKQHAKHSKCISTTDC